MCEDSIKKVLNQYSTVSHGNYRKRELNFSPQEWSISVVRYCPLKTQLRNLFSFINLSDRIKFTKYLELAKQDTGDSGAEDRQRRARAACVCRGPREWGWWGLQPSPCKAAWRDSSLHCFFPLFLVAVLLMNCRGGEAHGCRPVASVRDGDMACRATVRLQSWGLWWRRWESVLHL